MVKEHEEFYEDSYYMNEEGHWVVEYKSQGFWKCGNCDSTYGEQATAKWCCGKDAEYGEYL